jgi:hypothetical protein
MNHEEFMAKISAANIDSLMAGAAAIGLLQGAINSLPSSLVPTAQDAIDRWTASRAEAARALADRDATIDKEAA